MMEHRVDSTPFVLGPDEGMEISYLGGQSVFKISAEQTDGWGFAVETSPGGFASALHCHPTEDSGFFILNGRMRVKCGELDATAEPGAFIWLPRGVPHAFKVEGDDPCTWINVQGPTGDFRRLVEEIGQPASSPGLPPSAASADSARIAAAAERHHLERLGPSPF